MALLDFNCFIFIIFGLILKQDTGKHKKGLPGNHHFYLLVGRLYVADREMPKVENLRLLSLNLVNGNFV